jgi:hypothetical protein
MNLVGLREGPKGVSSHLVVCFVEAGPADSDVFVRATDDLLRGSEGGKRRER